MQHVRLRVLDYRYRRSKEIGEKSKEIGEINRIEMRKKKIES
jgi:hypothetical protein